MLSLSLPFDLPDSASPEPLTRRIAMLRAAHNMEIKERG